MSILGDLWQGVTHPADTYDDAMRTVTGGKKRDGFEMPGGNGQPVDQQYADPSRIGGGVGVEHLHGNDASTYTEAPDETQRYRSLGEAAAARQAYQVNFDKAKADEAQGLRAHADQSRALGLMSNAAHGNAPSQAAILGGQVAGQSLQAQQAAAANGRGLAGAAAAQQQAAGQAASVQQAGLGQFAGMRGQEMAHAQGVYGQGAGTMRTGDYAQQGLAQQRAEAQGQSEFTQRQLNQEGQMGYEQMGINNTQAQSDSDIRKAAMQAQANADATASHDARNARNMQLAVSGMSAIGTLGTKSDERVKDNVVPLRDERDGRGEQWYDRDVTKAKPDMTSGASFSAPTPKYAVTTPAPTGLAEAAARRQRKPTDAELKKLGEAALANVNAQRSMLDSGPSVRRVADGTKENGYETTLTDGAEAAFKRQRSALYGEDSGTDYDLRGAYAAGQSRAANGHMTDQFKKVNHETFSDESQYAADEPALAGHWNGEAYANKGPAPWLRQEMEGRVMRNQGAMSSNDAAAFSDERTKHSAPAVDMGAALEQGLKPYSYEYKPGFAEAEGQQRGDRNIGPMAQDMAKNPITGSAVIGSPDDDKPMKIDLAKAGKLSLAAAGYQAAQLRQQDERLKALEAKKKGGR